MSKKRVLSGVQPTGNLHLGNYLGAIRNWVPLQQNYDTFFCVVDLHALTADFDPKALTKTSYELAAWFIAAGVDPKLSPIFIQSHVFAHTQLTWLLNCVTSLNWLERMIQFKEKAIKQGENVNVGLMDYPVLMAADILLYQADLVPVGEDQKQHIELTRDIAIKFNGAFSNGKNPIFKLPEPLILKAGGRVMSLGDGTQKMSKSDPSEQNRINLLDTPDQITKKIKRCRTDSIIGLKYDDPERPQCDNLLTIYQLMTGKTREAVAEQCAEMSWGQFKPMLAEALVEHLAPIQKRFHEVIADQGYLESVLKDGRERAEAVANQTLHTAQSAMGLPPRV